MRKIATHYWLRPDGTLGKFPIVTLNAQNKIIEIRERETFIEEPSLELINGLLLPGFVDFLPKESEKWDSSQLKRSLNLVQINGVKALGVPVGIFQEALTLVKNRIKLVEYNHNKQVFSPIIERLNVSTNLIESLLQLSIENASILGVSNDFGSIEVGKSPGLSSLIGIDYRSLQLNTNSKLKLVI